MKKWFLRTANAIRDFVKRKTGLFIGILAGILVIATVVIVVVNETKRNRVDVISGGVTDNVTAAATSTPSYSGDEGEAGDGEKVPGGPAETGEIVADSPLALGETVIVNDSADIKTAPAVREEVETILELTGTVKGTKAEELYGSFTDLPIKQINVKVGDVVKAGDILASMDLSSLEKLEDLSIYAPETQQKEENTIAESGSIGEGAVEEDGRESEGALGESNELVLKRMERDVAQEEYDDLLERYEAAESTLNSLNKQISEWIEENGDPSVTPATDPTANSGPTAEEIEKEAKAYAEHEAKVTAAKTAMTDAQIKYDDAVAAQQNARITLDTEKTNYSNLYKEYLEKLAAYEKEQAELGADPSKTPTLTKPEEPDKTAYSNAEQAANTATTNLNAAKVALDAARTSYENALTEDVYHIPSADADNASSEDDSDTATKADISELTALRDAKTETEEKMEGLSDDLTEAREKLEKLNEELEDLTPVPTATPAPSTEDEVSDFDPGDEPAPTATAKPLSRNEILELIKTNSDICATADGVVTAINYKVGDKYDGMVFASIETEGTGVVSIPVSAEDLPLVVNGQMLTASYGGKTLEGTVTSVTPETVTDAEGNSGSEILAELSGAENLSAGTVLKIKLASYEANAVTVPEKCIQKKNGKTYVQLAGDISDYSGSVDSETGIVYVTVSKIENGTAILEDGDMLEGRNIVIPAS